MEKDRNMGFGTTIKLCCLLGELSLTSSTRPNGIVQDHPNKHYFRYTQDIHEYDTQKSHSPGWEAQAIIFTYTH